MDFWTPLGLKVEMPLTVLASGLECRGPLGCTSQPSSDRWAVSHRRRLKVPDINLPQFSADGLIVLYNTLN